MKHSVKKAISSFLSTSLLISCLSVKADNVPVESKTENNTSISASENTDKMAAIKNFCSKAAAKTKEVVTSKKFLIPAAILTVLSLPSIYSNIRWCTPRTLDGNIVGETDAQIEKYDAQKVTLQNLLGEGEDDIDKIINKCIYPDEFKNLDKIKGKVDEVLAEMSRQGCKNDYEKALFLHDCIYKHCTYNTIEFIRKILGIHGDKDFNTVSACLLDGDAICYGISKTYSILCNAVGIECKAIHGRAYGSGHTWNLIKINGQWYHVDVTWDLFLKATHGKYAWFLMTENEIKRDHTPNIKKSY